MYIGGTLYLVYSRAVACADCCGITKKDIIHVLVAVVSQFWKLLMYLRPTTYRNISTNMATSAAHNGLLVQAHVKLLKKDSGNFYIQLFLDLLCTIIKGICDLFPIPEPSKDNETISLEKYKEIAQVIFCKY